MVARALKTTIGGAIALAAYLSWPAWERRRVSEMMAQMLVAFEQYCLVVQTPKGGGSQERDERRVAGRLARTNLEATIERAVSEPGVAAEEAALMDAMLASSHRLANALIGLEAAVDATNDRRPAFGRFLQDVQVTLAHLASVLRDGSVERSALPDLREDQYALAHSTDSQQSHRLADTETDRIANSLNTLAGEINRWAAVESARADPAMM